MTHAQLTPRAFCCNLVQELVQRAGDVVFVPAGYFHATLNIGQAVAVACERTYTDPPASQREGGRGHGRSAQMTLQIPRGARPGQVLQAEGPEGPVSFKVPPTAKPGDTIRITVPLSGGSSTGASGQEAGGGAVRRAGGREL